MKVAMTHDISDERINDLLCGAFEGGSNYWIYKAQRNMAPGKEAEYLHDVPFVEGCSVLIYDDEDAPAKVLNRETMEKGLQVMANLYPAHMKNFLGENDDAETSDVFLQCCCFEKLVYG